MKTFFFYTALFFSTIYTFAQKIDLDNSPISVPVLRLPNNQELTVLKSYSASIYTKPETVNKLGLSTDFFSKNISLNGYEYQEDNGEILIEVEIKDFQIISESVETKDYTEKDNAGNSVTKTGYFVRSFFAAPTVIKIFNTTSNKLIFENTFYTQASPYIFESSSYNNSAQAYTFKKDGLDKRVDVFKKAYQTSFEAIFKSIKLEYDFTFESKHMPMWYFDLKKNPEFEEFNKKLDEVKTILNACTGYESITSIRERIQPYLTYCKENAAKTIAEDKRGRKIKYAYLTNSMRFQTYLELPDESDQTAQALIDNDYDKLEGKVQLLENKLMRETLLKCPDKTTHVHRPAFAYKAKFQPIVFAPRVEIFQFPKPPTGFKAFPGYIITYTKEKITGQLWAKSLNTYDLLDPSKSGAKFVYEDKGQLKEFIIDPQQVDEISLGRDFFITRYKFKNTMGVSDKELFFRKYYENDKVALLNYYSTKSDLNSLRDLKSTNKMTFRSDLCIMNKATGVIEPVAGLLNKTKTAEYTAEYYKGCVELNAKILKGDFGDLTQMDNQIKAADFFATNCK